MTIEEPTVINENEFMNSEWRKHPITSEPQCQFNAKFYALIKH